MASIDYQLRTQFGFTQFRPGQREAIESLQSGQDTLVVMPTSSGKSLIYQLFGTTVDGITIVISPLISLMKDQVDVLNIKGIPATYINSSLPREVQFSRLLKAGQGEIRFLYISPEQFRSYKILQLAQKQKVNLLAIDEAHCINHWGMSFRPDFLHLAQVRQQIGFPLTVALTATAKPSVQKEIIASLNLINAKTVVTGFNRPNIFFRVIPCFDVKDKNIQLQKYIQENSNTLPAIIYVGTRKEADRVAEFLRQKCRLECAAYHAGVPFSERTLIQSRFMTKKLQIVVATCAFGMGIDRDDIRSVIHYTIPASLEVYYQEVGRGGRDQKTSQAILLYSPSDVLLHQRFIEQERFSVKELQEVYQTINIDETFFSHKSYSRKVLIGYLERAGLLTKIHSHLYRQNSWDENCISEILQSNITHYTQRNLELEKIILFAEQPICRRRSLLQYFGDFTDLNTYQIEPCCDVCQSQKSFAQFAQVVDLPGTYSIKERLALLILDAIRKLEIKQEHFNIKELSKILTGQRRHNSSYCGKLALLSPDQVEEVLRQLVVENYLRRIGSPIPILSLTEQGLKAVFQKNKIKLDIDLNLTRLINRRDP